MDLKQDRGVLYSHMASVTLSLSGRSYTASVDDSSRATICHEINLGEKMKFELFSGVGIKNVVLQTSTRTVEVQEYFEITENCPHVLNVYLINGANIAYRFPVKIPFTLLTNEYQSSPITCIYEVQIKQTTDSTLNLEQVTISPSEMFDCKQLTVYPDASMNLGDVWQCYFELEHKLHQIDGRQVVEKSPHVGRLELVWINSGNVGKLQTAPLKRKEIDAVSFWASSGVLGQEGDERSIDIYIQNNCDQAITDIVLHFAVDDILHQAILPSGPVTFQLQSLCSGERFAFPFRFVTMAKVDNIVDCNFTLKYRIQSVDHCQPRELSFRIDRDAEYRNSAVWRQQACYQSNTLDDLCRSIQRSRETTKY